MKKRKTHIVAAALIERHGKYLITQRKAKAVFPLFWEFPGGKVESGETDQAALIREIKEEMDVELAIEKLLYKNFFSYSDIDIDFRVFKCSLNNLNIKKIGIEDYHWVTSDELKNFKFPPADEDAVKQLLGINRK